MNGRLDSPGPGAQQTGVCIVRVETEVDRLLITLTTERFLHRGLAMAGGREVHHHSDPDAAVAEIQRFLESYRPHGTPREEKRMSS